MNYSYDADADALYIRVREVLIDHQVEMSDGVVLDVASDGRLVGIDVMDPSADWDVASIISSHQLEPSEVDLLASLGSYRSWSPVRQPIDPRRDKSMTGHHEEPVVTMCCVA